MSYTAYSQHTDYFIPERSHSECWTLFCYLWFLLEHYKLNCSMYGLSFKTTTAEVAAAVSAINMGQQLFRVSLFKEVSVPGLSRCFHFWMLVRISGTPMVSTILWPKHQCPKPGNRHPAHWYVSGKKQGGEKGKEIFTSPKCVGCLLSVSIYPQLNAHTLRSTFSYCCLKTENVTNLFS